MADGLQSAIGLKITTYDSWITNYDRFWITKCDKNFKSWITKCNGIT